MNYTQDSTHVWVNLLGRDSLFYSDGRLEEERHLEFDMGEYTSIVSLSPTGQVFDYAIERHSLTNSVMGTVPLKTIVQEAVRTLSRRKN
jgi:hypothetical protein